MHETPQDLDFITYQVAHFLDYPLIKLKVEHLHPYRVLNVDYISIPTYIKYASA